MVSVLLAVGVTVIFLFIGECIGEYIYSRDNATFRAANFHLFETVLYTTKDYFEGTVLHVWRIDEVQYVTKPFRKDVRYIILTDGEQMIVNEKDVVCIIEGNHHDELNKMLGCWDALRD